MPSTSAYESLFSHCLLPAYGLLSPRNRLTGYLRDYQRSQWLAPQALQRLQLEKLNRLLLHAWEHVPHLQKRWRQAGLHPVALRDAAELAAYPILTKADILSHYDDLIARPYRGRTQTKTTGGSTGEPFRFEMTVESDARRNAVMWRGYAWAGARLGRRAAYLWGTNLGATGYRKLKEDLFHAAFNRTIVSCFDMSVQTLPRIAAQLVAARPEVIVGYVSALTAVAGWALEQGVSLHGPSAVLGAAEGLRDDQRELIGRAFGCPVYNTYGCREVMLIASECEQRHGLHMNSDHLVVETVDASGGGVQGAPGRVLLTDLHNYGMPMIRYENGDVAVTATRRCSCGRGLPLLERVEGRLLDIIRTPAGRILPGEFFPYLFKDLSWVREFQVIQREPAHLRVLLVLRPEGGPADLELLRRKLDAALGGGLEIQIDTVASIPRTASGKLRVTIGCGI
jgi:phenylacetate-CoA ligase